MAGILSAWLDDDDMPKYYKKRIKEFLNEDSKINKEIEDLIIETERIQNGGDK